ncbi:MAG TPA: hypothetical protein VEZ14_09490 [Dehalococcoidia bacterium]|nr:hypothetical protein [Dehalococcoidia bacterium]
MVTKKAAKVSTARGSASKARAQGPRNIWLELRAIGKSVSKADRSALPRDGARNLDHYLDGSPKVG